MPSQRHSSITRRGCRVVVVVAITSRAATVTATKCPDG